MPSIAQILFLLFMILIVVIPPVLILSSKRVTGGKKFAWFLGALFFSWLAYVAFRIATGRPEDHL